MAAEIGEMFELAECTIHPSPKAALFDPKDNTKSKRADTQSCPMSSGEDRQGSKGSAMHQARLTQTVLTSWSPHHHLALRFTSNLPPAQMSLFAPL